MIQWNRAQTIHAAPTQIWPWLVQMGYGRGGWYTNAKLDRLIWRIDAVNADAILTRFQHLAQGDIIADGPEHAAYFRVRTVDWERAIVYHSIRHPYRGHPVDPAEPGALRSLEQRLVEGGFSLDFSWAFVLAPVGLRSTRLIIRTRANVAPRSLRWLATPIGLVDAFHAHTILRGVRRRAEGAMSPKEMGPKEVGPKEVGAPRGHWGF